MPKKKTDPLEEKVSVMLIKDNDRYSEDLTVTYNGKNYQIKRGISVEVPRFLKLIIEESYRQQMAAADLSKQLEKSFLDKSEKLASGKAV